MRCSSVLCSTILLFTTAVSAAPFEHFDTLYVSFAGEAKTSLSPSSLELTAHGLSQFLLRRLLHCYSRSGR